MGGCYAYGWDDRQCHDYYQVDYLPKTTAFDTVSREVRIRLKRLSMLSKKRKSSRWPTKRISPKPMQPKKSQPNDLGSGRR